MNQKVITFDKSVKRDVLAAFGLDVAPDGYIVEMENPDQRVLSSLGNPINFENFAGIKRGSLLFYESDLPSLIDLADRLK